MVIPLWLHPTYNPGRNRLCSITPTTSQMSDSMIGSLLVLTPASKLKAAGVVEKPVSQGEATIDSSFVCPITGQRLPECACLKSSLKLHDLCVFCPAARLSS